MPETAASQRPESAAGVDLLPRLREIPFRVGWTVLALLLGAYTLGAALADSSRTLLREDAPFGIDVIFRINLVLTALIAYSGTVGLLEFRVVPRDLRRLRGLLDCDDATFEQAVRGALPGRGAMATALALGAVLGAGLATASGSLGAGLRPGVGYDFHDLWSDVLAIALFSLLGLLSLWGALSSRLYSRLSQRYARVDLLDLGPFQFFAARGLRQALYWFVGSAIALLLAVESRTPEVVLAPVGIAFGLSIASLVLPSLGIHRRMRDEKAAELERVRGEIRSRIADLRAGRSDAAAELPALLAWEVRVGEVPEWPIGGAVLARVVLLVFIPLGSWLGGALVERLVDSVLG